jgi:hypothetical protein
MRARRHGRVVGGVAAGLLLASVGAGVAHADPAQPTDYRTVVVSVTPPVDTVDVSIVGGDSFVELTVGRGTEVLVAGYQGEPYLRFRTDGTVEQNRRSPTTFVNADRYGGDVPADADADAPPDWEPVGTGGRYAWHDHRAHWMDPEPKAGAAPGDRILQSVIALDVDGQPVEVAVATDWLTPPSRLPLAVGAGLAGLAVVAALLARRRLAWVLLAAALAAAGIGWWQYSSLPRETGPLAVWWVLPVVAAGSAVIALILGWRPVSYALVLLAAIELVVWVAIRRDGVTRAVIPTDAPFWLDRGVMAATLVAAVVAGVGALIAMFRP